MGTNLEEAIRKRVIAAREAAGKDRADIAKALGLEYQSYAHYERGRYAFTVEQLFQLSRILNRSVEYFLGLDTGLKPDEDELLAIYRSLPEMQRAYVLRLIRVAPEDDG